MLTSFLNLSPRLQKRATVVFMDVAGSSGLMNSQGDMAGSTILARFLATLQQTIQKYEGSVLKSDGDDLLAIFYQNDDLVSVDHLHQAVLATIECQKVAEKFGLGLYTGLSDGMVLIQKVLDKEDISGKTVILAARLHKLIEKKSGSIFIDLQTYQKLNGLFRQWFRSFGVRVLKGLGELEVYEHRRAMSTDTKETTTHIHIAAAPNLPRPCLRLTYQKQNRAFDEKTNVVRLGRAITEMLPDVVHWAVNGRGVSRDHLEIFWEAGAWRVRDRSLGGTWLKTQSTAASVRLLGESTMLIGEGALCLGRDFGFDMAGEVTVFFSVG